MRRNRVETDHDDLFIYDDDPENKCTVQTYISLVIGVVFFYILYKCSY